MPALPVAPCSARRSDPWRLPQSISLAAQLTSKLWRQVVKSGAQMKIKSHQNQTFLRLSGPDEQCQI